MTTPDPIPHPLIPWDFGQTMQLAEVFARSKFFSDIREAAHAMVKIVAGRELGLPPMAAVRGLYVVNGQVTLSALTIAALIRRSGTYDYRVVKHTPEVCSIEFTRRGETIGTSNYTIEEARKAGLVRPRSPWESHPRNMLFARAMSNGAKWYCPDLFLGGIYAPDEFEPETPETLGDESEPVVDPIPLQTDPPSGNGTAARAELLATPEQLAGLRKLYEQLPDRSLWPSYLAKYEVKNARDLRATDAAELIVHLAGVRCQADQLEADIAKGGMPEEAGTKS